MSNTKKRINNAELLMLLGKLLRRQREQTGLAQGKIRGMRQATISKIENGGDVTLDTFATYANALGLELTLTPIGQGHMRSMVNPSPNRVPDLLAEFGDLKDDDL